MKNKKNAFSLIELLVVMVIIGILAGIGIASFKGNIEKAKNAKRTAECSQLFRCEQLKKTCQKNEPNGNCDNICDTQNSCTPQVFTGSVADQLPSVGPVDFSNSEVKFVLKIDDWDPADPRSERLMTPSHWGLIGLLAHSNGRLLIGYDRYGRVRTLNAENLLKPNQVHTIILQFFPDSFSISIDGAKKTFNSPILGGVANMRIGGKTVNIHGDYFEGQMYSLTIDGKEVLPVAQ